MTWRRNLNEFETLMNRLSQSKPSKSKNQMPTKALNREAGLWKLLSDGLRKTKRKIETTRLESWATPGVPDVLLCNEDGLFSFIELKVVKRRASKVDLSPHQCAWLSRHGHSSSFVVVREPNLNINVFAAADVVDLRLEKFSDCEPIEVFGNPYDWEEIFRLLSPPASV